ncbi:MAG: putative transglutaminase-like cysteine proteinase [Psychrobacter glaciei]
MHQSKKRTQKMPWLMLLVSAFACLVIAKAPVHLITPDLVKLAKKMYGEGIEVKLTNWGQLIADNTEVKDMEKLKRVNAYFNRHIAFVSDEKHWHTEDYWATPLESLGSKAGDCEDFVIAKYFSLIQAGIAEEKLRITYVKAIKLNQAHMVLAYYSTARSEPFILDNLTSKILLASKRRDLSPVYSFNGLGMWLERIKGSSIRIGDPKRLNMWTDLLARMSEQKMEAWLQPPVDAGK